MTSGEARGKALPPGHLQGNEQTSDAPAPFNRTTCACRDCVEPCTRQPGHLVPSDLPRIASQLGMDVIDMAHAFLWASPGAIVADSRIMELRRVGTITPTMTETGRCVFLTEDDQCSIHAVAPFGCAYFDTHMQVTEAQRRSAWGIWKIMDSVSYQVVRLALPRAKSWRPRA